MLVIEKKTHFLAHVPFFEMDENGNVRHVPFEKKQQDSWLQNRRFSQGLHQEIPRGQLSLSWRLHQISAKAFWHH